MRITSWPLSAGFFSLCLFLSACAVPSKSGSASPVSYQHIVRRDPNYSLHVVTVDLGDPRVSAHVSRGGPDPDGAGPWLTTLLPPSEIAQRENDDIAINGDFFAAKATVDIEGKQTGYVKGKSARPEGPAMTDGQLWCHPTNSRPYLEITASNTAVIVDPHLGDPIDPAARQIVGGGQVIVRDGQAVIYTNKFAIIRNPRTVVGISTNASHLVILVVDGRRPQLSIGMTLAELSTEMLRLGCASAINLDGGGSTVLVYRNPKTRKLEVLNSPSDGKERSVADILGITVQAPMPAAE